MDNVYDGNLEQATFFFLLKDMRKYCSRDQRVLIDEILNGNVSRKDTFDLLHMLESDVDVEMRTWLERHNIPTDAEYIDIIARIANNIMDLYAMTDLKKWYPENGFVVYELVKTTTNGKYMHYFKFTAKSPLNDPRTYIVTSPHVHKILTFHYSIYYKLSKDEQCIVTQESDPRNLVQRLSMLLYGRYDALKKYQQ
jgi:hypothetical protein